MIRLGTVHILRSAKDHEVAVAQLGAGAHFGEMSFVDGEPRSAKAVAVERTELLEIGFDARNAYFDRHPDIAVKFCRALSHFLARRLRPASAAPCILPP